MADASARETGPVGTGPDPIAPFGPRLGAFLIDVVASALVAGLFTAPELPRNRSLLVFAVVYFGFTVLSQRTPGMYLLRLAVVRVDRRAPIGLWRALVRTVGVILVVPALLRDRQGRSLHDRITQTAVIRVPPAVPRPPSGKRPAP